MYGEMKRLGESKAMLKMESNSHRLAVSQHEDYEIWNVCDPWKTPEV
jgi:hypothetical protein